jgi:hypothetical protein
MDSSDLQNILDLDYPVDKEPISAAEMWSRWRNHRSPDSVDIRLDTIRLLLQVQCRASRFSRLVDITEHTLDGEAFSLMRSRLTFDV